MSSARKRPWVTRRMVLSFGGFAAASLFTGPASAGTYLDTATLFVGSNRRDNDMLRKRPTDKALATAVHRVAEARSSAAADMTVPEKVAKAHPHLLLTLAKVERAAQAAKEGNPRVMIELLDSARTEDTLFREALKELGFALSDK